MRQIDELERQSFIEAHGSSMDSRMHRLTDAGRWQALGGKDPLKQWERQWDGLWRLVIFDVPVEQNRLRDKFRLYLRKRGFGFLQNSVWTTPDPVEEEREFILKGHANVKQLMVLESSPCGGESDQDIVAAAWDFDQIEHNYIQYSSVLKRRPRGTLSDEKIAHGFRSWAREERMAWQEVLAQDPFLPSALLPDGYIGKEIWRQRIETLRLAGEQIAQFRL